MNREHWDKYIATEPMLEDLTENEKLIQVIEKMQENAESLRRMGHYAPEQHSYARVWEKAVSMVKEAIR